MNSAEHIIRTEIAEHGPISFARFMELALYAPGVGYYEQPDRAIGRRGDFYTSVSVGPMLGFLLASHFLETCSGWDRVELVEAGAHDGRLAHDILKAAQEFHPDALSRIQYRILEPSPVRRARQEAQLASWKETVSWLDRWEDLSRPIQGFIFANELLDALPVQRFVWDAATRAWSEAGVDVVADRLTWCRIPLSAPPVDASLTDLPDGFVFESSPAAQDWWRAAAMALGRGWLLTLDYGYDAPSPIRPDRPLGTARAYSQHRVTSDLLTQPGEQDLTADVDFQAVLKAGQTAGLNLEAFEEQGRWLTRIAARIAAGGGPPAEWLQAHARQFQTLTHPNLLGSPFKVLVQRRG